MKEIEFMGTSRADIKGFSDKAKSLIGYELHEVQCGNDPSDWKPMTTVGSGVREIRVKAGIQHRVIYVANVGEVVYVLHAFTKKTQKTPKRDIELARQRFSEIER